MLLEALSVALFAAVLVRIEGHEVRQRALERLAHQATSVALQAEEAYRQNRPDLVLPSLRMMGAAPSVARAMITDPAGNVLFVSAGDPARFPLESAERAQIASMPPNEPRVFAFANHRWEGVKAIHDGKNLRGYAWVETDRSWDNEQLDTVLRSSISFGLIWIGASGLLVLLMSRSISRPLSVLQGGTRALMEGGAGSAKFPLPVTVENEFGDLIEAFNRMVAVLEEQRSGLNETLSLLDSMLANAPIGLVFFDRQCHIVRVNEVFAGMTGIPLNQHLGRALPDLLPERISQRIEEAVRHVVETGAAVHDLELEGQVGKSGPWTWLITAYPVRPTGVQVRWVGVIVIDVSERKRSEDALRRTEKLAATGRLAASIAHEINNPLEAITNLLYLLRRFCSLDESAMNYVAIAEREVHRMSEITQQTLRFYRQSTLPARATMEELLDSVLDMYGVRLATMGVTVERHYDPEVDFYCFAGEVRQVIANLVSNAMDAMPSGGGRLIVSARRSRDWVHPQRGGVRITVADTGTGMTPEVRARLFEAFFTTKGATGTGLGLWVSHEIILKHHGIIHLRSRTAAEGHSSGTAFQIFFPDHEELLAGVAAEEQATAEA